MHLNMILSNGAFLPIDNHTRVIHVGNSRSIDHVITKDISNTIFSCVFLSDISDHFPIAIIVEHKNKKQDIEFFDLIRCFCNQICFFAINFVLQKLLYVYTYISLYGVFR